MVILMSVGPLIILMMWLESELSIHRALPSTEGMVDNDRILNMDSVKKCGTVLSSGVKVQLVMRRTYS